MKYLLILALVLLSSCDNIQSNKSFELKIETIDHEIYNINSSIYYLTKGIEEHLENSNKVNPKIQVINNDKQADSPVIQSTSELILKLQEQKQKFIDMKLQLISEHEKQNQNRN